MVIALIAALLGFSGIAAGVAGMAQVPFWLFLALSPNHAIACRGRYGLST